MCQRDGPLKVLHNYINKITKRNVFDLADVERKLLCKKSWFCKPSLIQKQLTPLDFEPLSNWTTVPFISSLRNGMKILKHAICDSLEISSTWKQTLEVFLPWSHWGSPWLRGCEPRGRAAACAGQQGAPATCIAATAVAKLKLKLTCSIVFQNYSNRSSFTSEGWL